MTIDRDEAIRVLKIAYPDQDVGIQHTPKGSYKIVLPDGTVLGAAFDLQVAVRQAVQPYLKAEAERIQRETKAKEKEFVDFMAFLRARFNQEFNEYRKAQVATPPSNLIGVEPRQGELVHIIP